MDQLVNQMAKATGLSTKQLNAALKDYKKLGLPKWVKKSA
jgi:hypothetical protein